MEIEDDSGGQDLKSRTALPSRSGKSTMVGLDKELIEILNWLDGNSSARDTLSIVGMPGIGKTTFARKIYDHQRVQEIFHVRAWVTVSQNYDERKILLDLLESMKNLSGEMHNLETSDLKDKLHKNLKGRRYLIVIDDIWDTKVWNDVNRLFPVDQKRSRIILTTRLESVAVHVNSSRFALHRMRFLNDVESWNLFCKKVFGGDCCPGELYQTGTEIAKKCGGLPLAIVLVGGLLSKSNQTQSYWDHVAKNLSSVIASHDDQSSKILHLSYNNLPYHLRACFLYMGIFPEDYEILASKLVKLWTAGGFIETETNKSLEDVAEEYLLNLVERNLISVSKRSSEGKIKICKIHDLLREFCVREAKKESLFHVTDTSLRDLPTNISTSHITDPSIRSLPDKIISLRRVSIHPNTQSNHRHAYSLPTSAIRSVLNFDPTLFLSIEFLNSSLIRVLDTMNGNSSDFPTETVKLLNLRYLACLNGAWELPSLRHELRNLQTLILSCMESSFRLPLEIWRMPQLRHVHLDSVILPDPPTGSVEEENSLAVLHDLQSLSTVMNFKFVEDILRRIPNLKKLGILFDEIGEDWSDYCLNNLALLQNLEALKCLFNWPYKPFLQTIIFPPSLKKLTLRGCFLPWEDMTIIGSLEKLQVLKLKRKAFSGTVWEPKEGEFLQLKFLLLEENNLEYWNAESTHFPNLEHLILDNCQLLKEVPCDIGQILTLQKIELYYCRDSLVTSAKDIYEEQQDLGNEDFQVRIVEMTVEEYETC
ncbi:putative late blight resistance protein homolog R1A-10 [Olea europaea var. sylvestris]|uniref:putative late blight resistance protein homolog R1A-10 n=1 Tax=Olea europaea var. sylvestris TaxID=158386 RepID=UPI000C1D3267|nr:putative late blight resistance protein homolog R1A-10 [Olea europaea var. sylvestris]